MNGHLGVDVGSVSVKMTVIDDNVNILAKVYLRNEGIIKTLQKGLEEIEKQLLPEVIIKSVGITGSGREFTKFILGADIMNTEISAHSTGTLHYYPDVKTIMDIGGEDCKCMIFENGTWSGFQMNLTCGAGTGAMLEAISSELGIKIEDVGDLALKSKNDLFFSSKCGTICRSDAVTAKNSGALDEDILMASIHSLVNGYMRIAEKLEINPPYVFQGMTAKNKAIIKVLEGYLKHKIFVHLLCEFMGSIGMCIVAKDSKIEKTNFRGFKIKDLDIKSQFFRCKDCGNNCKVVRVKEEGKIVGYLGSKCGKYVVNDVL